MSKTKQTEKSTSGTAAGRKRTAAHEAPRTPRKKKKSHAGLIAAVLLLALLFFGTALWAIYVQDLDTIYPNVTYAGVDVGGMTITQAEDALAAAGYGAEDAAVTVDLPLDHTLTLPVKEAVSASQPIEAAAALYAYGREGNLAQNLITYLRCLVNGYEPEPGSIQQVKADYVKQTVSAAVQAANAELMGSGLEIGETAITAVKGARSVILDETEIYTLVMSALEQGEYGAVSYTPQSTGQDDIDLQSIYETVHKEPKNAEYDPETQSAGEHVTGVSFDLQAAQAMWDRAAAGERVVIPLVLTEPEITRDELNSRLFADVLAEKSTSLWGSSAARINNVKLACKAINDRVLNPGEEFSYNTALGKRTTEAGYQAAGAYSGGEVVQEVGGGICQVSSTLYYCTLYSDLKITARTCHYFGVGYITPGLDATVSWGGPEFKFVNDREYPIKIQAAVDGNSCTVRILGTDMDGSYVEMATESWVNSDGSTGVTSYRLVYDRDGNLLSRTKESDSRYHVHKEEEEESPSPSPSPSPTPSPTPTPEPTPEPVPEPTPEPEPSAEPEPGQSPEIEPPLPPEELDGPMN